MNYIVYFLIFISKIIENTLSTLRLIVVANGKKLIGAILQFIVALVWVFVTGAVIIGIRDDKIKIVFFSLGSLIGSYVGSIIEEKLSLGNNLLISIVNKKISELIIDELKIKKYDATYISNDEKTIIFIEIPRKEKLHVINIIKKYDKKSKIILETTNDIK
ncbi:MAG: hypothetical protein IJ134_00850 [Bacilli bacterium]|nr:hypothetical protein [Bacilli bacterium]